MGWHIIKVREKTQHNISPKAKENPLTERLLRKGYQKGWLDEATQHFQTACSMEPGNTEYRQALSMMQQGGASYRPAGYGYAGCDPCTTCMCISCASPCC